MLWQSFVWLLPLLAMMIDEINTFPLAAIDMEPDDSGRRGAALALAAAPVFYIVAVLVCYGIGPSLLSLGLKRLGKFMAGVASVVLILGTVAGPLLVRAQSGAGFVHAVLSIAIGTLLLFFSTLPAALCWWFMVAAPLRD